MSEPRKPGGQRLVVITRPIASGKTTVARRRADVVRKRGQPAASIDIDELVEMIAGADWSLVRPEDRDLSCEVAAAIAERLFDSGVSVVVVAGSTLSSREWDQLLRHLVAKPDTLFVLLRVSLGESVRRAQGDPTRVSTKDPNFVSRLYSRIDWADVPRPDIDLFTDSLSVEEVVEIVARAVFATP